MSHTGHRAFPQIGPGNEFRICMEVFPVSMVCFPNSICTATFTAQLTSITQKVMNPARAPRVVVAISSPDPTIPAERINPGPRFLILSMNETGGTLIFFEDS